MVAEVENGGAEVAKSITEDTRRKRPDDSFPADGDELGPRTAEVLSRRAAIGLAVTVVRRGRPAIFSGHGLADIASSAPVTEDTVFRIGSITKTFTAVAVMQLWEQGLIDLDAPANDYLGSFKLVPAKPGFRPATVRHLLTHSAGIPEVLHLGDLLHPGWGPFDARPPDFSVPFGEALPPLAERYRGGIRLVTDPGTAFAYSGHGFNTLGQIVEEISGEPLDRYFRRRIFEPLGMAHTDLVRSERVTPHLASGYVLGPGGAKPVVDREWLGRGAGGMYSSSADLGRYAAALLGGGSNQHGSILQPATLAAMFDRQYRPDPRLVGMGLGFFCHESGDHRIVGHDGILPGFNSSLMVAPDDGVAVLGLINGSTGGMVWLPTEMEELLDELLDIPGRKVRTDLPQHPELWSELCGQYRLPSVGDLRGRLMMGAGARVVVRGGRLMIRLLTPIPALYQGFPLRPDDEHDPHVFSLDLSRFGMPPVRLVFDCRAGVGKRVIHTDLGGQPISLYERPASSRLRTSDHEELPK